MSRLLLAFGLWAALAVPAAAQLQPAPLAPARAANWVEVGHTQAGDKLWFDSNSIHTDTYYRTAMFRFQKPGGEEGQGLMRFDCDGGRFQFIDRFELVNGVATPIPHGEWEEFREGQGLVGSYAREKLCSWR